MKIISNETGKISQVFVADEIKPIAGTYPPELIRLISERYGFSSSPSVAELAAGKVPFKHGRLIAGNRKINVQSLSLHNDGLVIAASNTDDAEFVLQDALAWGAEKFGFREPQTPPQTFIENHAVVEFSGSPKSAINTFEKIRVLYEKLLEATYNRKIKAHFSRLGIGADQTEISPLMRPDFGIERRIGMPYSADRYFSVAPLRTDAHWDLLQAFDELIAA